ncbi:TIGR04563 family protein [Lujinxingia vulgaris]|uniref:TIGR04563 family protein n=2 Tax=Lujinxingia TaxID=2653226 RepID=A0A5C6XB00_9DELT|nr:MULTISPECIES: TIGR04563 family protein [Lujinxingia]RDV39204.1 TIGR04563 family protein [Bradymonadaceae bacterium TMQ3]RVU48756.1 TIGR04563 family protein [Lujinxingia sediminis]TXC78049.1 TIGR04563 family protein [Bradymonadales bacterium TMQ1]TXD37670.1 TIGR04563 family protein [Lujinxingia vulgaris]
MASDKRKQSLYFPEDYLDEIREESLRQDRSMSWVVQKAWEIARETIKQFPAANDYLQGEDEQE